MEERDARDILRWRYTTPYDFYDPPDDDRQDYYVSQFLKPELMFHAIVDAEDRFVGYCSYGLDGQVPGGDYSEDALDIGLGMRPEFTGQGRGAAFFNIILDHGIKILVPDKVRLTVASFNRRAMRLYENFGFIEVDEFSDALFEVPYTVLTRDPTNT
ncbi:MAG: GNAT family N-acetyltransferase [Gammaproteobacteria bacterium]|nr:GNAT family N-acetyltransferase [Gammaproteobacteria bacterium]MBT4492139.1 GNAT family N-acetyltransferase [Gammaproteobacteria bacterium]MBT7370033.1 GNAT family N-acetyltransferase [Gammaproteobacteria bacterium]